LFGIVFGLGSLHAILHALVFTVGLGVARSITGIAIVQAALWIWPSAHRPDATPADGGGQNLGQANPRPAPAFSFLAVAGWVSLLPFLVLWPLLWLSSIFTESWPWHRLRPWGAVVGGSALWLYVTHQSMPGPVPDASYPIIDTGALLLAGGVAGLGVVCNSPRFRRLGVSVLAIGMAAVVVLFARSAAMVQPGATARPTRAAGVGLRGARPHALATKCWMYFPRG